MAPVNGSGVIDCADCNRNVTSCGSLIEATPNSGEVVEVDIETANAGAPVRVVSLATDCSVCARRGAREVGGICVS